VRIALALLGEYTGSVSGEASIRDVCVRALKSARKAGILS
jgi:hypothetical protein